MGAWGELYQESDSYLDLFAATLGPIWKQLNKKVNAANELDIVSAAGLLYDILQDPLLYEKASQDMIDLAIAKLIEVIEQVDFKAWTYPAVRKHAVRKLLLDFKLMLEKRGPTI